MLVCFSCTPDAHTPPSATGRATSAIEGGTPDTTDIAVVAIANTSINELCTGELIAPNLVLTAAHCIAKTSPTGMTCDTLIYGGPTTASHLLVTASDVAPMTLDGYASVSEALSPAVAGGSLCGTDLALLLLAAPLQTNATPPADIPPITPRLDEPASVGEVFTAIGYGQSGGGAGIGTRRELAGLSVACTTTCGKGFMGEGEWLGHAAAAHTGGRPGDSGSPAIDANGDILGLFVRHLEYPKPSTAPDELVYTALDPHRDFLREGAKHAAAVGNYAPPEWALDPPSATSATSSSSSASSGGSAATPTDEGGCSVSTNVARSADTIGGFVTALALAGAARRRAQRLITRS